LRITGYPQPEGGEGPMKMITTLAAAALIAASATVAMAQGGAGGGGVGASGGGGTGGTSGAGADPSAPRQNLTRPTPASPSVNKRGDDMAPLQGSNVSGVATTTRTVKHKKSRMYR
jgi:hypothetical protein